MHTIRFFWPNDFIWCGKEQFFMKIIHKVPLATSMWLFRWIKDKSGWIVLFPFPPIENGCISFYQSSMNWNLLQMLCLLLVIQIQIQAIWVSLVFNCPKWLKLVWNDLDKSKLNNFFNEYFSSSSFFRFSAFGSGLIHSEWCVHHLLAFHFWIPLSHVLGGI